MGEILGQKIRGGNVGQATGKSMVIMPCSLALANCLAGIYRWYLRDKKKTIAP